MGCFAGPFGLTPFPHFFPSFLSVFSSSFSSSSSSSLEHMLFLGTEKYPNEDEYGAFVNSHGGSANAYTDHEHTNFHFDVNAPHLEQALNRFAQVFSSSSFSSSSRSCSSSSSLYSPLRLPPALRYLFYFIFLSSFTLFFSLHHHLHLSFW